MAFEQVVDPIDLLPCLFKLQSATKHLEAEMVFLIDHDRHGFVLPDRDAPGALGSRVRLADQMPFDQKLAVNFRG